MKVLPVITALTTVSFMGLMVTADSATASYQRPILINTCLITNDVPRLTEFYRRVLRIQPKTTGADYAEFPTGAGVLAIFSAAAQEKYIPRSAQPANNRSAILEFRVDDVDKEYARLKSFVEVWVKLPATTPWGTRSTYFRDPDGNLLDFFSRAL